MKSMALKVFVSLFGAFAVYYAYFLGSVFYELYGPNSRRCGTPQAWALQAAAIFFAPPAMLGSGGLWFVGGQKRSLGAFFQGVTKVTLLILILCSVVNLLIFVPTL